jgi:LacI family transcriptional regulator
MKGKIAQAADHFRVALLIETSHEFGREVLRGVRDYERGLDNHWAFYLQPDGMRQEMPKMGLWPCTGVIARFSGAAAARQLARSGLPLILLDPRQSRGRGLARAPYITTDTDAIVEMAFEHLYAGGCRTFAFVHSAAGTVWSEARGRAFAELARRRGFGCHVFGTQPAGTSWSADIRRLGAWIARLPAGLGVFAAMDQRGRQVIEACREKGIRVPGDVMVLGVDNDPLVCELCEPSLSSVALDAHRAGFEAARLLDRLMRGGAGAGERILVRPTHVSRRQSTSSGFDQDGVVAEARRYIFERLADPRMQVGDVATRCGVSRRLLETRFVQSVGRTLLQELTELRMERARTLLRDTPGAVAEVAAACGFSGPNYFTKAFRRRHGLAPLKYRASFDRA